MRTHEEIMQEERQALKMPTEEHFKQATRDYELRLEYE
jgi:hypothetical protein